MQGGTEPFFEGIPKIQADRLRGLIEQNLDALGSGGGNASPDAQFEEAFRKIRDRMNHNLGERAMPLSQGAQGDVAFQQKSVIRLMDGNGSVEINSSEGDTQVKVRDRENKVVWSGPWNTEEDKASAPKDIRGRIDKVNSGSGAGFSFHFGTTRDEPDTLGH